MKRPTLLTLLAPAAALCAWPAAAQQPAAAPSGGAPASFGAPGQIAVSADLLLDIRHSSFGSSSTNTVRVQPALDFFLLPSISVGGLVGLEIDSSGSSTVTTISVQARGGYALRLLDNVSLWARIGIGYDHQSQSGGGNPSTTGYSIPFTLFVPVLFIPAPHLFIGAGPFFDREIVSKFGGITQPNATDYGLQSIVGGYFGGG